MITISRGGEVLVSAESMTELRDLALGPRLKHIFKLQHKMRDALLANQVTPAKMRAYLENHGFQVDVTT